MGGRALILQHERSSIGSLPDWVAARGFEPVVLLADEEWSPPNPAAFDFLVSMGSASSSFDDEVPWLARELALLDEALEADTPILGICFGSQALARALGGVTRRAIREEIGWLEVETAAPELIPAGPWLFWHEDSFEAPPGAELLAHTEVGHAAFRADRHLALQFHPEATPAAMEEWLGDFSHELDPADVAELRRGMESEAEAIVARAWALYDRFLAISRVKAL
ncbi:MAG TPA: type 1 glutamine amidotransferase [Solirubrobacterales bacterium]|nr:type 1 glutamine amidotransferase [Solirubrobacterales bacterium]